MPVASRAVEHLVLVSAVDREVWVQVQEHVTSECGAPVRFVSEVSGRERQPIPSPRLESGRRATAEEEAENRENEEYEEGDLRESRRCARDSSEAEEGGDQGQDEKSNCCIQHVTSLFE